MSSEEKEEFLSNCRYFYYEKGEMERYVEFSMEKLEEADPVLANAYRQFKLFQNNLERLMRCGW